MSDYESWSERVQVSAANDLPTVPCPACGHAVVPSNNGWHRHQEFCAIGRLHAAVIEASVVGASQGRLPAYIRRKVDDAVADIQQQVRYEEWRRIRGKA